MSSILEVINSYSPFEQSLIGSAVFLFSSWLVRLIFKKAKNSGAHLFHEYSKIDVVKHTLHKEYINTNNMQFSTFGSSMALLHASRWVIKALLISVFFVGLSSILKGDWLYVVASWFSFNCILEANSWVKDSSSDECVSHVPEDVKNDIYNRLKPQLNEHVESGTNKTLKSDPVVEPAQ
ncbi:V3/V1b-type arginine vasotocin receptor [Shewanella canadensis]|uniref:V3/V1b-type arginine vasotocin receptor n=1 Tax=Shewanella canadensis TaxID=271096 RepID=A0A3S0KWL5_9GAMM|nr:V3/V1b-type arginine vasotocin receptor [Shewanella canadensis]RTR40150.1 V3/V1b-type arginine vasotocin receptor [Shewanella canadensis]